LEEIVHTAAAVAVTAVWVARADHDGYYQPQNLCEISFLQLTIKNTYKFSYFEESMPLHKKADIESHDAAHICCT
jgi:hypothetical protein